MAEEAIQCYNKGCGSKFKPQENNEDSCCFHPGAPVFHDAYKGWGCCNKKSTDFTTFLSMKGCTKGYHNPEKPEEVDKKPLDTCNRDEVIVVRPPTQTFMKRPDFGAEMTRLVATISPSLKQALENGTEKIEKVKETVSGIPDGEPCKNNGCKTTYDGEHSKLGLCLYHPGFPIFHEGMKYWSCCQRKTSDFEMFLQQEGCSTGTHIWIKKAMKRASCRYDWHQTPTQVIITVYAKLTQPDFSSVDVNPIRVISRIAFGDDQKFELDLELGGVIDPAQSNVTMAATKVEIKLKKAEPKHWNKLFIPSKTDTTQPTNEEEKNNAITEDPALDVDGIDLSDI